MHSPQPREGRGHFRFVTEYVCQFSEKIEKESESKQSKGTAWLIMTFPCYSPSREVKHHSCRHEQRTRYFTFFSRNAILETLAFFPVNA